ncbi:MAG: hypothetical protein F4138_01835 [Acidimicrobiia bacterium]|nr:hypothetical protein [Acidimicrobiia bacterium]
MNTNKILTALGASVLVLAGLFWIGATIWFFGDENPDRIQNRAWVAAAEVRCATARDQLTQLPQAREATDLADRANQIDAATAVLTEMTVDLAASTPAGADGELLGLWFKTWNTYLNDRQAHANALREGEDRQFRVTIDLERGDGVDALLDAFADRNRMPSCGDPLDIG